MRCFITLDVDWAPDWTIDAVATFLADRGLRSTWFVTHQSKAIDRLRSEPGLFELGIHPNFLPGSTHGSSTTAVLDHMMSLVPEAQSIRSHAAFNSGPLIDEIASRPELKIDSSVFLPMMPGVQPVVYRTERGSITRLPFIWADDHAARQVTRCWDPRDALSGDGDRVFLFHPLHVVLNSASSHEYRELKQRVATLQTASPTDLSGLVNQSKGVMTFLETLADLVPTTDVWRLANALEGTHA